MALLYVITGCRTVSSSSLSGKVFTDSATSNAPTGLAPMEQEIDI